MKRKESFLEVHSLEVGKEGRLLDFIPLAYGSEECDPGHDSSGIRPYYMIHYVRAGRGRFYYRGQEHTLGPGQIFIVSAGEWHRYEADREEPWSYSWICFGGRRAPDLAPLAPVHTYPADTFRRALHAGEYGDAAAEYVAGCLFEILSFLLREERLGGDGYAERARHIVNTLYMLPITVGSIAAQLSLDRRYLPRLFRARYGITLQEYLIRVRMEHAARYLEEGYNAEEAGRLSGYEDAVNFYRMFKRYFGESTGEYRRRIVKGEGSNA
jgi:AraC-like DNA-binding protein